MPSLLNAALLAEGSLDHSDNVRSLWISIAGVVISVFAAWITTKRTIRCDERNAIRDANMRMLEWAIEYPLLETPSFCGGWPTSPKNEDERVRYDFYCCHVFNLLHHSWAYSNGDETVMRDVLFPDEIISMHHKWWLSDDINQAAYPAEFRQFVADKIRKLGLGGK